MRRARLGATILAAACVLALLVHLHPDKLRAPEWVAWTAIGAFALAGVCIIAQALRLNALARWLPCVLLAAMTAIPAWIAFGAGPRQCTAATFGARSAVSEVTCRGVFGAGALILAILFAVAVRGARRPPRRDLSE